MRAKFKRELVTDCNSTRIRQPPTTTTVTKTNELRLRLLKRGTAT